MYRFFKKFLDLFISFICLIILFPLFIILAFLVKLTSKGPVFFKQERIGLHGKVFKMLKFRSMCVGAEQQEGGVYSGKGDKRVTKIGRVLRATSLDELPQLINILKGDMSIIGPRPQLVRDMVFMTEEQRQRHTVKPGLSGLAQVNGRNDIDWEDKLNWDLKYIKKITFVGDVKIIFQTVMKAFIKQEGITEGDMATAQDFGDYLLEKGEVSKEEYDEKQEEAKELLIRG